MTYAARHREVDVNRVPILAVFAVLSASSAADAQHVSRPVPGIAPAGLVQLVAQSWSCTPRKTCSQIRTCDEAYWYLAHCSWGKRLDGDKDGVPCESICQ